MESYPKYSICQDEFKVEVEILNKVGLVEAIDNDLLSIDEQICSLNNKEYYLTNHSDIYDYAAAASAGVITALIDSFFVGKIEIDVDSSTTNVKDRIHAFINNKAKDITTSNKIRDAKEKCKKKGIPFSSELEKKIKEGVASDFASKKNLSSSIKIIEDKFKLVMDNAFTKTKGMNPSSHHLDDFAHHPTPLGFIAAVLGEIFHLAFFVDKNNEWHIKSDWSSVKSKDVAPLVASVILVGLLIWLQNIAKKNDAKAIKNLPNWLQKIVIAIGTTPFMFQLIQIAHRWIGHLISDIAGSHNSAGAGMGIPGIFISLLKEIGAFLNTTQYTVVGKQISEIGKSLAKFADDLYENENKELRVDMRKELGGVAEGVRIAQKMLIPVIIGDAVVRVFYFVRRFSDAITGKSLSTNPKELWNVLSELDWKEIIPFDNRTIIRMTTIEAAVFTGCDVVDAAVRAAIESKGIDPTTYAIDYTKNLVLRVNFIGVGKLFVDTYQDVGMGVRRTKTIQERQHLLNQWLLLYNAKVFYSQSDMWSQAASTEEALNYLTDAARYAFQESMQSMERASIALSEASVALTELSQEDRNNFQSQVEDLLKY